MSITKTNSQQRQLRAAAVSTMFKAAVLLLLIIAGAATPSPAQQNNFDQAMSNTMRFFDASGRPFVNPVTDYTGSVYFTDSMRSALITMNTGKKYPKIKARIDLLNNEIHYLDKRQLEMFLPAGMVENIVLLDSSAAGVTSDMFRCGFPPIDGQDPRSFYRVLEDGQLVLLESIRKKIVTDHNAFTGEISKECRTVSGYYVFSGSVIQRLKNNQSSVLGMMGSRKQSIKDYAAANQLNDASIDTIKKLVSRFNLLTEQQQ